LWETQGQLMAMTGAVDQGLALLAKAVDRSKKDYSHHSWGNGAYFMEIWGTLALQTGKSESAEEAFLEALAHDPGSVHGALGLQVLCERQGRPEEARRYAELAQCFVDEYAREIAIGDLHVNGRLTLGENLADNGGLRLAFRAAHLRPDEPEIDGFTSTQRLFLAWAQIRCENATEATMRLRTQTDGHSPGRLRVNVVVSNMAEFASAFQCAPTAAMARADRCVLW